MLHPDRAVPLDDLGGAVGTEIYQQKAAWPFIGLHGHEEAGSSAENMLFADPAQLLRVRDHSATRMLVSQSKCTCRHLPVATRLPRREYFRQILL